MRFFCSGPLAVSVILSRLNPRIVTAATLVLGLTAALTAPMAQAGGNPNPGVLPPNANAFGRTYGEWAAAWLQWSFSLPVSSNPNFDPTGALANNGQSGHVVFLASVINLSGPVERTFTVPAGKAIFSPILAQEGDNSCVEPPLTVDQLRAALASFVPFITEMHGSIDGVPLRDLLSYRVQSPVFSLTLPVTDNVNQFFGCNVSGTIFPAVSDGFWIMLAPLPQGRHDVRIGGTVGAPINFSFELLDHITVGP